jgi:hypothetical protein
LFSPLLCAEALANHAAAPGEQSNKFRARMGKRNPPIVKISAGK